MSWIRDADDDLINLDHVKSIYVVETESGDKGDGEPPIALWQVLAAVGDGTYTLFEGTETDACAKLDAISAKLPMVRGA